MNIGIIGGGMMGLTTAYFLSRKGHQVTVFEKESEIGGLSRSEEILPGLRWDRFYHVILSTDEELLNFIDEIGLSLDLQFKETKTGFFTDGHLHSMSSSLEFLTFKPLSLWSKLRLGAGILYASKINNWKHLEKMYAKTWLIRVFGRRNYEKLWDPLLRSKFGNASSQTSGAFIWAAIKRYYGTRHNSSKKEMMGCVSGGYHSILKNIQKKLLDLGVEILLNSEVNKLETNSQKKLGVYTAKKILNFDRVLATVPNPHILNFWSEAPVEYRDHLGKVAYLSLVCVTLVLEQQLCPFYVMNLTDNGFPFTGVIEATNVIPAEVLQGRGLVYLPRYMPATDQFYNRPDADILKIFIGALRKIFPNLSDDQIIAKHVHRESHVQPIQKIDYSNSIPPIQTPLKNFYMVNTTMILNSTLNNNEVIKIAKQAARIVGDKT